MRRTALVVLRLLVAAVLLLWLARSHRLNLTLLLGMHWGWAVAAAALGQIFQLVLPLSRWFVLLRLRGLQPRFGKTLHIGLLGTFTGVLVPASLGLDAAKLYYARRCNRGRDAEVISTVIVDRVVGVAALGLFAVAFGSVLLLRAFSAVFAQMLLVSAAVLVAVGGVAWQVVKSWTRFSSVRDALRAYRNHPAGVGIALALSLLGHACNVASAFFAFRALGLTPPLLTVLAVFPVVILAAILPISPLGLGVSDTVAATLFASQGLAGGAEVTTILRCLLLGVSVLCAPAYIWPVDAEGQTTKSNRLPHPVAEPQAG